MIKLKDLLNEASGKIAKFEFNNRREFEKAENALSSAGWYRNGSGNPPSDKQLKQDMIFDTDDHWNRIEVGEKQVKSVEKIFKRKGINYNLSYRKAQSIPTYWAGGQYT